MNAADITALRAQTCKVFGEMGMALACLEDVEGLLDSEGLATLATQGALGHHASVACSALGHERFETARASASAAADHLAKLVEDLDRIALALAPKRAAPATPAADLIGSGVSGSYNENYGY